MQPEETVRQGRCDCGNLRFTARGEPVHTHACACTECQRGTGSVMSHSAWFPADRVTVEGDYTVHHHRGPEHPDRYRCFCPTCGTGRFFRSGAAFPGTIGFAVGSFADPDFPPPRLRSLLGEPAGLAWQARGGAGAGAGGRVTPTEGGST